MTSVLNNGMSSSQIEKNKTKQNKTKTNHHDAEFKLQAVFNILLCGSKILKGTQF